MTPDRPTTRPIRSAAGWLTAGAVVVALVTGIVRYGQPATPVRAAQMPAPVITPPATPLPAAKVVVAPAPPEALAKVAEVRRVLSDYRQQFAELPVGNNAEITRALMGRNPKGVKFLIPGELPTDAEGQLVDHWQTPYFFHQLSGTRMEIHSAGPDRQMHTPDDVVAR